MADYMEFPKDWKKFLADYSFRDHKEFYTNGSRLIATFRVEQMMEHYLRKAVTDNNVGSKWIPVTERLPGSGVHVLLCCEIRSNGAVYKKYVCDGYYAKRYTEQTWNNSGDIACEYREEDDEYYLLEGWYEVVKNWDDYNSIVIGDFVTHWMPLPEPPKEE